MTLDPTDLMLLEALQRDAAQRLEDLGRMVQLAPSSVHDRLRRLERDGVIRRWTVTLDPDAVGLGVLAFVGVRSTTACVDLVGPLEAFPEIEEMHSVAGELCLLLKVRVSNPPELLALIDRLRQIHGVDHTETTIVLKTQIERPIRVPAPVPPKRRKRAQHAGG